MSKRTGSGHDYHGKRGRHRKRASPETLAWEREQLLPKRPPWMPQQTYTALSRLRGEL
jgi:hypothetical protein